MGDLFPHGGAPARFPDPEADAGLAHSGRSTQVSASVMSDEAPSGRPATVTSDGSSARPLVSADPLPAAPHRLPGRWPLPDKPRVIAVANQKGGVGKTTTSVNLAAALAQHGASVLLIDMDPQANATTALSLPAAADTVGSYDVLVDSVPLADAVYDVADVGGLRGVPSSPDLAGAQIELVAQAQREFRLRMAIESLLLPPERTSELTDEQDQEEPDPEQVPDYILIDCPPGLDLLTVNALVAAHEVLVPMQCEYYSMEGISQLHATVAQVREYLNPDLGDGPILLTMFDEAGELSADVVAEVRDFFPERTLRTVIPRCPDLAVAPSHGQSVVTYRPHSRGALAYEVAAYELAAGSLDGLDIDAVEAGDLPTSVKPTSSGPTAARVAPHRDEPPGVDLRGTAAKVAEPLGGNTP